MQKKYYHPNFEKMDFLESQDNRKKEFIGFRLQADKFMRLKNEAQQLGIDLSELIRKKLESV